MLVHCIEEMERRNKAQISKEVVHSRENWLCCGVVDDK